MRNNFTQRSCFTRSGATHSTLIIANGNGELVAKVGGEGTNHWMVGIPEVGRIIAAMSTEAKKLADIPESTTFKCIGLSLSGCEHESTNAALEREMRKEFPELSENYVVCSDTLGSILTVSNLGGLVVIAGTGSNALLRNPDGGLLNLPTCEMFKLIYLLSHFQRLISAVDGVMQLVMKVALGGFPTKPLKLFSIMKITWKNVLTTRPQHGSL